jgi:hypothetical protein
MYTAVHSIPLVKNMLFLAFRPCKGVSRPYEKMAELYNDAVFLKLYGNANLGCKQLFKHFKVRSTPSFLFFRNGMGERERVGTVPGNMQLSLVVYDQ